MHLDASYQKGAMRLDTSPQKGVMRLDASHQKDVMHLDASPKKGVMCLPTTTRVFTCNKGKMWARDRLAVPKSLQPETR